ncbi:MAG: hypothetical protein ACYCYF_11320, partial [Anaerolineae bacterium]
RRLAALPVAQSDPSVLDMSRWQEAVHLRQTYGNQVWPGWADADIPTILYNQDYAFLLGLPQPESGWTTIPGNRHLGIDWESASDHGLGIGLYRQRLTADSDPQAFATLVGERWVAGMATQESMRVSLAGQVRAGLPPAIDAVFPSAWMARLLVPNTDSYITLLSHESFHAYQGMVAPERLWAAERMGIDGASTYPWEDEGQRGAWRQELTGLADALRAEDPADTAAQAQQFIEQRQQRRSSLSPDQVRYEQEREWAEGLARYAELELWRLASLDVSYQPEEGVASDPEFHRYQGFDARWRRELSQIGRMADDEGDGRYYYSGMSQAYLLDRVSPGWKQVAFQPGAYLDDLLAAAVNGMP